MNKSKKVISALLFVSILLTLFPGTVYAINENEFESGHFSYRIMEDNTAEITKFRDYVVETGIDEYGSEYMKYESEISIPEEIDGYTVTSIASETFANSFISSFTIPDSIDHIGNKAFYRNTDKIININISSLQSWCCIDFGGETTKDYNLYLNDVLVTDLIIPDDVSTITPFAFYSCKSIENVTIPDTITRIGQKAFYNTSFYLNNTNWEKQEGAMSLLYSGSCLLATKNFNSSGKVDCVIKDGTRLIAEWTFYNGYAGNIIIADSVKNIGDYAFMGCKNIKGAIPKGVESIGAYALGYGPYITNGIPEKISSFTITGNKDSVAEKYATENGFEFVDVTTIPEPIITQSDIDTAIALPQANGYYTLKVGETISISSNQATETTPSFTVDDQSVVSAVLGKYSTVSFGGESTTMYEVNVTGLKVGSVFIHLYGQRLYKPWEYKCLITVIDENINPDDCDEKIELNSGESVEMNLVTKGPGDLRTSSMNESIAKAEIASIDNDTIDYQDYYKYKIIVTGENGGFTVLHFIFRDSVIKTIGVKVNSLTTVPTESKTTEPTESIATEPITQPIESTAPDDSKPTDPVESNATEATQPTSDKNNNLSIGPDLTTDNNDSNDKPGQSIKLKAGQTYKLTGTKWHSTNTKVATVKNGKITALKKGSAIIKVYKKSKLSYLCVVKVTTSPKLSKKNISVKKGKTASVKILGKASSVNNVYTNTKRAKIISKKTATTIKVRGLKKGKTTLKIKVNGVALKLKVKVK